MLEDPVGGASHQGVPCFAPRAYGESDLIAVLLTEDYGKLSGIARGARRSRRRFSGPALEPLHEIELRFKRRAHSELVFLHESRVVESYDGIAANVGRVRLGVLPDRAHRGRTTAGRSLPTCLRALPRYARRVRTRRVTIQPTAITSYCGFSSTPAGARTSSVARSAARRSAPTSGPSSIRAEAA